MKSKIIYFMMLSFLYASITVYGQKPVYPRPGNNYLVPFDKKLLPPVKNEQTLNENPISGHVIANGSQVPSLATEASLNANFHLTKDITPFDSYAGFFYKGLSAFGDGVLFNAFTPSLGGELYKSNGTAEGTVLLNDINTGPGWSYPNAFLFKNNVSYFIDDDAINTAIYKTNGTSAGLQRVTAYIDRNIYFVVNFNVTDNGQVFYILGNKITLMDELWHSNGTNASGNLLTSNINYNDYVVTIDNTGFFVAGDLEHGYELWKSDGTPGGTKLVKDIFPGPNSSSPYSLFAYKKDLYFGAWDGIGNYNSLWKSDATDKGTIKLKDITVAYFFERFQDPALQVFCVSHNKLYLNAMENGTNDAELWQTNGTSGSTKLVKNINPYSGSYPTYLTDVNGTLYFTADDGVHGTELWSSNGNSNNTKMVKDITPYSGSSLYNLCSAGGKLYFLNSGTYPNTLWSSGGTDNNTNQVMDEGLNGIYNITNLTPSGNKLFFGGQSDQYGKELYKGDAINRTFTSVSLAKTTVPLTELNKEPFNAMLYPNPATSNVTLQITGNSKYVSVSISDTRGKKLWQSNNSNGMLINLPVEKYAAGIYVVTVTSGIDRKTIRLVKQ